MIQSIYTVLWFWTQYLKPLLLIYISCASCVQHFMTQMSRGHFFSLTASFNCDKSLLTLQCLHQVHSNQCIDTKYWLHCLSKRRIDTPDIDYAVWTNEPSDFIACKVTERTGSPKDQIKSANRICAQCEQSLCDFSLLLDMFVMWVTHLSKTERQRKDFNWVLLNDFSSERRNEWSRPNKRVRCAVKKSKTCCTRARSAITTCAHKPTHVQPDNLTATVMTSLSHLSLPSVFLSLSLSLYNSPAPFPFITVQISLLAIQSSCCHLWHYGSYFSRSIIPPSPHHHYERCDNALDNRCVFRQGREGQSLDLQPLSLPRLYLRASPLLADSPLPSW